jgi:hypothetical protein
MKELTVSNCLADYFTKKGLHPIEKFNAFDHVDDVEERTFIVDLAIGPTATKGNRTEEQIDSDTAKFRESSGQIDQAVEDLMGAWIKTPRGFTGKLLAVHGEPLAWRGGSGKRQRLWVSG